MLPMYMTLPPIYETAAVLVAAFMAFAARTLYSTKDLPNQSSRISADDLTKQSLPRMDDRSWEAAMSLAERASLHTAMAREMKALSKASTFQDPVSPQHLQEELPLDRTRDELRDNVCAADVQAYAAGLE